MLKQDSANKAHGFFLTLSTLQQDFKKELAQNLRTVRQRTIAKTYADRAQHSDLNHRNGLKRRYVLKV